MCNFGSQLQILFCIFRFFFLTFIQILCQIKVAGMHTFNRILNKNGRNRFLFSGKRVNTFYMSRNPINLGLHANEKKFFSSML